jgi:nucleotidyltransferase substrate binding protein (TIGR01987 family)
MATERPINLAPLERANARLGEFLEAHAALDENHPHLSIYRTAVVKGYEFTHELAYGSIRRSLEDAEAWNDVDRMTVGDVLRAAADYGIISSAEQWFYFRERRNDSAHEYFDTVASRTAEAAPALHQAVTALIATLTELNERI